MSSTNGDKKKRVKEEAVDNDKSSKKAKSSSSSRKNVKRIEEDHDDVPHPDWFNIGRVRTLTESNEIKSGNSVLYWMSRDKRAEDNWALLLARYIAEHKNVPLAVCFNLTRPHLNDPLATLRAYGWMMKGLKEVESTLKEKHVPMYLLQGQAADTIPTLAEELKVCAVVTDFSPLREPLAAANDVAQALEDKLPLFQVDAHNIVPVWKTSEKQEVGARTIRKKIHDLLPDYLVPYPAEGLKANPAGHSLPSKKNDWDKALASLKIDRSVPEIDWLTPGAKAGAAYLEDFIENRLKVFSDKRNDPTVKAISNMSPYFNFGQVSVQTAMLGVKATKRYHESIAAFIEEGIVRRELSDNFCFYQPKYDSLEAAAGWARESVEHHSSDPREWLYSRDELDQAKTHDKLWNAAQLQLVKEGKLHGFLRMYWAKKILEWTDTPANALAYSLYFNDRYAIDGRNPNGFVGCGWSVMGIHDMGWPERTIFGKIRFMNYDGCKRKFDVDAFCRHYPEAETNAKQAVKSGKNKGPGKAPPTLMSKA